jgi:two-component sensor histidine kinase
MLQACVAQQGGSVELDWQREGLICRMRLPGA